MSISLIPRPHPQGGKRVWWLWAKSLVWLTTHRGICVSQSVRSFSPVIWLTNCKNVKVPLTAIQIWIANAALLTNHILALFNCNRVRASQTKQMGPKSPDPFPSLQGWGSGDETTCPYIHVCSYCTSHTCDLMNNVDMCNECLIPT